jgi:signal transduction histidine kinase
MNIQSVAVILLLVLSSATAASLSIFAWQRRSFTVYALPFSALSVCVAEWAMFYALEIIAVDLASKMFWAQLQYIGLVFIPVCWLVFALLYSGHEGWFSRKRFLALSIFPVIILLLVFTNSFHGLIWRDIELGTDGPFLSFQATYGPGWWAYFGYSYLLMFLGTLHLFLSLKEFAVEYRWQLVAVTLAPLLPWIANALYIFRLSPIPQIDLAPFAFTISALIFGIGIFRFRLFDIVPIARSKVIDSMDLAMIVIDNHQRVVDLNAAARCLLQVGDDSLMGVPADMAFARLPDAVLRLAALDNIDEEIELEVEGAARFYQLTTIPLKGANEEKHIARLINLRDITIDRRMESALALVKVKNDLLAKVNHELRTPLNGLLGLAEMLDYGIYGSLSPEQKTVIRQMIDRANYLSGIVNELLLQSQLEDQKVILSEVEFSVEELIRELDAEFRDKIYARQLRYVVNVGPDVPAWILGDRKHIYQILSNLVSNACKFTQEGSVEVSIERIDAHWWAFEVKDTGIGIQDDVWPFLFDAFAQANYTMIVPEEGIGLGLSIVRQLVNLMQGKLSVESKPGSGSTFHVKLPLKVPQAEGITV